MSIRLENKNSAKKENYSSAFQLNDKSFLLLFLFVCTSFISINIFITFPIAALSLAHWIVILYIYINIKRKDALILFLLPILLLIVSNFFNTNYKLLGDGEPYFLQSEVIYNSAKDNSLFSTIVDDFNLGFSFFYLKYHEFGFFFIDWFTLKLFGENADPILFFYTQSYYHTILTCVLVFFDSKWKILATPYRSIFYLFILISPSFLELQAAPTRHIFSFFILTLFYYTILSNYKKKSFGKFLLLVFCFSTTLLNKPAYIIIYILFIFYLNFHLLNLKQRIYFSLLIIIFCLFSLTFFTNLFMAYYVQSIRGSASFTFDSNFLIWPFIKFFSAIMAPFPWYKWSYFIDTIYGGNWIMFIFHIISSLFALWVLIRLIFYYKKIIKLSPELKNMIVFGCIVGSSIFLGPIGFHSYLVPALPFFSCLLIVKKFNVNFFIIVFIGILLNSIAIFILN